jgi:hypothetical protein
MLRDWHTVTLSNKRLSPRLSIVHLIYAQILYRFQIPLYTTLIANHCNLTLLYITWILLSNASRNNQSSKKKIWGKRRKLGSILFAFQVLALL